MSGKRKKKNEHETHWRKWLRKRTRPARHLIVYLLMRGLFAAVNILPIDTAVRAGARMGLLAWRLLPHLRQKTRDNMEMILGAEIAAPERERLARRMFENAGRGLAEILTYHRWGTARVLRRIAYRSAHTLPEHQAAAGEQPVMIISAHYGSWEFLAAFAYHAFGSKLFAVVRDLSNPRLDKWLMAFRNSFDFQTLHRGQAGTALIRKVREGRILCMLADQFIDGPGVTLPFLGHPAHTFLGPAILAQRLKAKLLIAIIERRDDGLDHTFTVEEVPMPPLDGLSKDEQVIAIARAMNNALSAAILNDPAQWMWFHDRWRRASKKNRTEKVSG